MVDAREPCTDAIVIATEALLETIRREPGCDVHERLRELFERSTERERVIVAAVGNACRT